MATLASRDAFYWVLRGALDLTLWGGELVSDEELPRHQPAVFVANHAGALGPIGVAASLPVRLHPWVIGDMLDPEKAGPYLEQDFVRPALHLPPSLARPVAAVLSRLTVPLLRSIGCIPVWQDRELLKTYRLSGDALAAGRSLLIFPEDPTLPINPRTAMRPFKTGFAQLGSLYHGRAGGDLQFYPVAVHRARRRVELGRPALYNSLNREGAERRRVAHVLESAIAQMLTAGDRRINAGIQQIG